MSAHSFYHSHMHPHHTTSQEKPSSCAICDNTHASLNTDRTLDVSDNVTQLHEEALVYILSLAADCHRRGGYSVDEALQLQQHTQQLQSAKPAHTVQKATTSDHTVVTHNSIEHAEMCTTDEPNRVTSITYVLQHLMKAQQMGHLSLHEAWVVYNAQQLLVGETVACSPAVVGKSKTD